MNERWKDNDRRKEKKKAEDKNDKKKERKERKKKERMNEWMKERKTEWKKERNELNEPKIATLRMRGETINKKWRPHTPKYKR